MKELGYLNKYFIKYKYSFLIGIATTIVAQIFSLFTPKLISKSFKIIESYSKEKTVAVSVIQQELISLTSLHPHRGLIFSLTCIIIMVPV